MSGCGIELKEETSNQIIMVKPNDPVWLVNDLENVEVMTLDSEGNYIKGVVKRIHAGSVIWYDHNLSK
jgi:hypothetical protein